MTGRSPKIASVALGSVCSIAVPDSTGFSGGVEASGGGPGPRCDGQHACVGRWFKGTSASPAGAVAASTAPSSQKGTFTSEEPASALTPLFVASWRLLQLSAAMSTTVERDRVVRLIA